MVDVLCLPCEGFFGGSRVQPRWLACSVARFVGGKCHGFGERRELFERTRSNTTISTVIFFCSRPKQVGHTETNLKKRKKSSNSFKLFLILYVHNCHPTGLFFIPTLQGSGVAFSFCRLPPSYVLTTNFIIFCFFLLCRHLFTPQLGSQDLFYSNDILVRTVCNILPIIV